MQKDAITLDRDLQKAVTLLQQGKLVAFPTDTVYGLGALATHSQAIKTLFSVKRRDLNKPVSLLIPNYMHVVRWGQSISSKVLRLAEAFWPGPLTILLHPLGHVPKELTAHTHRIGLRVPNHPIPLSLLSSLDNALAAPSANISGQLSTTHAISVQQQLGQQVAYILKEDTCSIGIESTVIDMTASPAVIQREGAINTQSIRRVLKEEVIVRAPRHVVQPLDFSIQWIKEPIHTINNLPAFKKAAIITFNQISCSISPWLTWVVMPSEPKQYQRLIYQKLAQLKDQGCRTIFIECLPPHLKWQPVTACLNRWCKNNIEVL